MQAHVHSWPARETEANGMAGAESIHQAVLVEELVMVAQGPAEQTPMSRRGRTMESDGARPLATLTKRARWLSLTCSSLLRAAFTQIRIPFTSLAPNNELPTSAPSLRNDRLSCPWPPAYIPAPIFVAFRLSRHIAGLRTVRPATPLVLRAPIHVASPSEHGIAAPIARQPQRALLPFSHTLCRAH
jgi:hypothetical protein